MAFAQVDISEFNLKFKNDTYESVFNSLLQKITEVAYHEFAIYPFSLFQLISQVTPNLEDYIKQDRIGVIAYNDLYNSPPSKFSS